VNASPEGPVRDRPAREALLDSLAVSQGGRWVRVIVVMACTLPVVVLLDLPQLLIWLAALLAWDMALVAPLERHWVLPLLERRFETARRRRALMVLFGLSLTQGLPLAAWSTGEMFGAVVGACWVISTSTHVLIYYSRDRLLLGAGIAPVIVCALTGPALSAGVTWESLATSMFLLMSLGAGGAFVARSDDLIAKAASEAAARRSAEAASNAKTRFIANMHHELRTPLNAIIGYSELLRESAGDDGRDEDAADLERVLAAARLQLMMMNDLLAFSELQDGAVEPVVSTFDAAAVAREAAEAVRASAQSRGNSVALRLGAGLEAVRSDPDRLRQCLWQLLSNAAKFTQNGAVELRGRRERAADADWIVFDVQDTGVGIAREQLSSIFEPFTQADSSATRRSDGAGIGLAIARRFARLLGGDVSVESALGLGSTFTLRVRADLAGVEPAPLAIAS
jgi:signal transduction histidine kinase